MLETISELFVQWFQELARTYTRMDAAEAIRSICGVRVRINILSIRNANTYESNPRASSDLLADPLRPRPPPADKHAWRRNLGVCHSGGATPSLARGYETWRQHCEDSWQYLSALRGPKRGGTTATTHFFTSMLPNVNEMSRTSTSSGLDDRASRRARMSSIPLIRQYQTTSSHVDTTYRIGIDNELLWPGHGGMMMKVGAYRPLKGPLFIAFRTSGTSSHFRKLVILRLEQGMIFVENKFNYTEYNDLQLLPTCRTSRSMHLYAILQPSMHRYTRWTHSQHRLILPGSSWREGVRKGWPDPPIDANLRVQSHIAKTCLKVLASTYTNQPPYLELLRGYQESKKPRPLLLRRWVAILLYHELHDSTDDKRGDVACSP